MKRRASSTRQNRWRILSVAEKEGVLVEEKGLL